MLQIKLLQTGPGGITRKLTFPQLPLWTILATRIETLYAIPSQNVGLTYIDSDGDEITISSQDELQDYHMSLGATSFEFMKLTVKDLAVSGARRPPSDIESSGRMHDIPFRSDVKPPTTTLSSEGAVPEQQANNNSSPTRSVPSLLNFVSMRSSSLPRSHSPPQPPPPIIPPPVPVPIPQGPRGRSPYRPQASPMPVVQPPYIYDTREDSQSPSRPCSIYVRDTSVEYSECESPRPELVIYPPSGTPKIPDYRSSSSQSRSPSPVLHHRMPPDASSPFGLPINFRHEPLSPGLFGPRSPVPVSRSHAPYEGINGFGHVSETRPPVLPRRSVDSLILNMAERSHVADPVVVIHSGPPSRAPSRQALDKPHIRMQSTSSRSTSPYRDGYPIRYPIHYLDNPPQQSKSALPQDYDPVCRPTAWRRLPYQPPASPFRLSNPPKPVNVPGEIATDKATISNLDITNLKNVILNEARESMAIEMWESVQARFEEEKEKLLASVRTEMASARDELANLTDDLDAANEQLRALGGIHAAHQEIIKARQEIQQARDEVARAREATGRSIERIKDEWEETRATCEQIQKAWSAFERNREESQGRTPHPHHIHHPHFPHMPWVPPFPVPPPPPIPSGPGHHRGLPPFVHRPPPAPMRPPPPPPPPPHSHPGHFHPHFHPPPRPHHHFGMVQAPLRPNSHSEASDNDIRLQEARERGLRRRSTFPGRLNPPHGSEVLRAKFSDGGLRFGVDGDESGNGFEPRHVDLLGTRNELEEAKKAYKEKREACRSGSSIGRRGELKEARKVYEEKREAWNRERTEARKGVLVAAGLGVRPFDTMTFPPAQPRTPAVLATHAEESSNDEDENRSHRSDGTALTESVTPFRNPRVRGYVPALPPPNPMRPIMMQLNSMGFTQEQYPYLPRLVQEEVQRTDASEMNVERMVEKLVDELLRN